MAAGRNVVLASQRQDRREIMLDFSMNPSHFGRVLLQTLSLIVGADPRDIQLRETPCASQLAQPPTLLSS
ncbi:MAG: hypothetical protein WBN61_01670, partial [Woeseiaceae bacterium]